MALENLTFRSRMWVLAIAFLVGLLITHVMYILMLANVSVNGPLYQRITQGKDLVADILPPPEYVIESYLLVFQMVEEEDPATAKQLAERFAELEREYQTGHDHWVRELEEGPLKEALVVQSYQPATEFYRAVKEQIIPKLGSSPTRDDLRAAASGIVRTKYELHRRAIDEAVKLANQRIKDDEQAGRNTLRQWMVVQIAFSLIVLVLVLAISWQISRGIIKPTANLLERVADMAEGEADLTKRVQVSSNDEIGRLGRAVNQVIQKVHDLIVRVRTSTVQLFSTANEIAAAAEEQNTAVQGFGASTSEIASSVKEISATGQELLETMGEVSQRADHASSLADSGRTALATMENTMQQLSNATGSISAKLGVIREKASAINMVVTTITKVADQTNLLSINAAIEAEKAGDAGRGFLVVAREIRRLADQTAVATLDIEQMVRHMQSAVSGGVMEMDKFGEEVRTCITQVGGISQEMGDIIGEVHSLDERFNAVTEGMRQQAQGAAQIDEAMGQLVGGVKQASAAVRDFNAAASNLRESAVELQQEVGRFTVTD